MNYLKKYDETGAPLSTWTCVPCDAKAYPSLDGTYCIPCPDPNMAYDVSKKGCACVADYRIAGDVCIKSDSIPADILLLANSDKNGKF